jgi:excisionase family DNA binding protein
MQENNQTLPGGSRYDHPAAAEYLGVTPGTLAKWRSIGRPHIPYYKLGRKVIYHQVDLQAYLDKHHVAEVMS